MFKKLKDKITEEVKSSPQRIQQFTQSVTEKIQNSTNDDNFFTITDDDSASNVTTNTSTMEPGFSNVALTSTPTNLDRHRRSSVSSLSSDISFLPRYEPNYNAYHMQSDLDISASEIEDNMSSTSSQVGNVSKEQMYSAFQKAQMRYHKYRGRYTDLANHYKELERENAKMKSVLVDTQDKAIRRVMELKEQCGLEQKAKAHLESALRLELDEKEYVINTLKTKIDLLQNVKPEQFVDVDSNKRDEENMELLTKYLNDARLEIESLNSKIQEHKANKIILDSKATDQKQKINELNKLVQDKLKEIEALETREKENNLTIAETKMQLHAEIQNKDLEIEKLKTNIENLKVEASDNEKNKDKSSKLENLQMQNTKLIEKIESLTQKCKQNESELLKLEQFKIEIQNLNDSLRSLKQENENLLQEKAKQENVVKHYKKTKEDYESLQESHAKTQNECRENIRKITELQVETETLIKKLSKYNEVSSENDKLKEKLLNLENNLKQMQSQNAVLNERNSELARQLQTLTTGKLEMEKHIESSKHSMDKDRSEMKQSLLQLETKIKNQLTLEFNQKEEKLKADFALKLQEISSISSTSKQLQINLMERENELAQLKAKLSHQSQELAALSSKYTELETNHLELIGENNANMQTVKNASKSTEDLQKQIEERDVNYKMLLSELELLQQISTDQQNKICDLDKKNANLSELGSRNEELLSKFDSLQNKIADKSSSIKKLESIIAEKDSDIASKDSSLKETAELIRITEEQTNSIIADNENSLAKLSKLLEAQNVRVHTLEKELSKVETEKSETAKLLTETLGAKDSELDKYKRDCESLKLQLEAYETEKGTFGESAKIIESLRDESRAKDQQISSLEKALSDETLKLNEQLNSITSFKQLNDQLALEISSFKSAKTDAEIREANLKQELDTLRRERDDCLGKLGELGRKINELGEFKDKYTNLLDENSNLKEQMAQVANLRDKLAVFEAEKTELSEQIASNRAEHAEQLNSLRTESHEQQESYEKLQRELQAAQKIGEDTRNECEQIVKNHQNKSSEELSALTTRNHVLETDYKTVIDENESLLFKLENFKLKLQTLEHQLGDLTTERNSLLGTITALESAKSTETELELQKQLDDLSHERQLLLEEIQELKTAPISFKSDESEEVARLHEKIREYKSLDLTNRTSIEFYETELQKQRNKNEKLNRKLDETLVTLNHCAELSHSTEVEYLKNVLYNYMLGKEGLVLARVIAAVCKFDPEQTEAILQREQQKQTLLGQLGIL